MVKGITQELIRSYLDDLQISSSKDNEGDLYMVLSADDDFGHDVVIYFFVEDNQLGIYAFPGKYKIEEDKLFDAMVAVNNANMRKRYISGFIKDNSIQVHHWFYLDEAVSEEYIKENCLKMMISTVWNYFVDLKF